MTCNSEEESQLKETHGSVVMPVSSDETGLIDCSRPEISKAIELAKALKEHCHEHKLPAGIEIYGMAINAYAVKREAYYKGRQDEQKRISMNLDLLPRGSL